MKLSISCFSWCHLKQCNSQERKYSWTFKYCVTEYGDVLVSIWSQWPYFTGWLGNVCEKSQWSTIYLLHHLGFCIFLFFFYIFILPFSAIFQVMASQQPNLQFFLLRHLGFCTFLSFVYLNIFCLIVSYFRRWLGSENPQWSTIYLSQQIFHRQTNFVFF